MLRRAAVAGVIVLVGCGHTPPAVTAGMVLPSGSARSAVAHPHGPDADDGAVKPLRWIRPAWTGGGRHPIWRGCQHVYDPLLNRFINGPGLPPAGSGT